MIAAFSRSTLSPAPGHNGFGDGRFGGSRYHFLHHAFLECNYGTSPVMPFDHLLGSYRGALPSPSPPPCARMSLLTFLLLYSPRPLSCSPASMREHDCCVLMCIVSMWSDDPPKFAKIEGDTSKGVIFE